VCGAREEKRLKLRTWSTALLGLALLLAPARAQPAPAPRAAPPAAPPRTVDLVDGGGNAGAGFLRPGEWGGSRLRIENPTDREIHALATGNFNGQPTLQFGYEIVMPPHTRLAVWQPVRAPDAPDLAAPAGAASASPLARAPVKAAARGPKNASGLEVKSILLAGPAGDEHQLARKDGMVRVEFERPSLATMTDSNQINDVTLDFATALKSGVGRGKRVFSLRPDEAPPVAAAWQVLDSLILSAKSPPLDEAQLAAMRHWVLAGGKLWIMLDRVDPGFCRRLLREDWTLDVIDRVGLTDVTIEGEGGPSRSEFETPVDMVRVVAHGMEVTHRVNGWPAALSKRVGRGAIVVTTVGARAWMSDWFIAREPLMRLGRSFLLPSPQPPLTAKDFQAYLSSQIGYSIVSRKPVAIILTAFCLAILGVGLFLQRRNRLEWLGAFAALGAVVVAGVFILIGLLNRWEVPLTVAGAQLVRVVPAQDEAVVTGELSVYSPKDGQGPIEATRGGVVWPDMAGQGSGDVLRMVWTDIDKWQWRGLTLPSGAVRNTEVQHTVPLAKPARVTATFDENGVVAKIRPGPFEDLQDLVIATPAGHLAPRGENNVLHASQKDVLPAGQYLAGGLVGQVSGLRQKIYRQLLGGPEVERGSAVAAEEAYMAASQAVSEEPAVGVSRRPAYPDQPMLLAWAKSMSVGIELVQKDAELRQSALVIFPLAFDRPAAGSTVRVPSPFVPFTPLRRRGNESNIVFDPIAHEWIPSSQGAVASLRFQLPRAVCPLRVTALRVLLDIAAAGREVEVTAVLADGSTATLGSVSSPAGLVEFDVPEEKAPQPDAAGGITLTLRVDEGNDSTATWRVHRFGVEVAGKVEE
jgi:hypothetical protein